MEKLYWYIFAIFKRLNIQAVLVGSALMGTDDPGKKAREIVKEVLEDPHMFKMTRPPSK